MLLQEMKTSTSDVMKSEIQRRLEEADRRIRYWKEEANKEQSEVNSREEELRLLKKEGGYENATNTTITTWMVIFVRNICQFCLNRT